MPAKVKRVTAGMFRGRLRQDEMLPEFRAVRKDPERAARSPAARAVLRACDKAADTLTPIPSTTYTLSREWDRSGIRKNFDQAYFLKRRNLTTAAILALFRPGQRRVDLVQDYIWSICEETSWVVPEHAGSYPIDLFAAETAFGLAEMTHLLGDRLDDRIVGRVRSEVKRRILDPYLDKDFLPYWFDGHNNWTGVCASSVAGAFLHLEADPARLAKGINRALGELDLFRTRAFRKDGGSSEAAAYWQYGLINTVAFAELLRLRTGGRIDVLSHEKFGRIARFPLAASVAPGTFYNCSDCRDVVQFSPGFLCRLAERAGADELKSFLNRKAVRLAPDRLQWSIRDILWWDGRMRRPARPRDCVLPDTGIARLVNPGRKVVVMAKAGNNLESHNHNDVGSFEVYVGSEVFLCDPGCGLYDGTYFGPRRYENPVCNSYGHGVPRIGTRLQGYGKQYRGEIIGFEMDGSIRALSMEFSRAYPVKSLKKLERRIRVEMRGAGSIRLADRFTLSGGGPPEIEEAFMTWKQVAVRGATARLRGANGRLVLKVLEPAGVRFAVEDIPVMLSQADKPKTLRRIACVLPKGSTSFVMQIDVVGP